MWYPWIVVSTVALCSASGATDVILRGFGHGGFQVGQVLSVLEAGHAVPSYDLIQFLAIVLLQSQLQLLLYQSCALAQPLTFLS